jgi:DNA-binding response OmpR family regulator
MPMHTHPTSHPETPRSSGTTQSPLETLVVARDVDGLGFLQRVDGTDGFSPMLLSPLSQAYAQIKRWHPSLIVICTNLDDVEGCQLLTMLTVDPETRQTPILVLTTDDAEDRDVAGCPSTPFWLDSLPAPS